MTPSPAKPAVAVVLWVVGSALVLGALHVPIAQVAAIGPMLDPAMGLYRNARRAEHPSLVRVRIPGLQAGVTVERDERGVPHIFAQSDRDATMALGYVVAQDRLVQLDFLPRVAAGRLAEIFGPDALEADRNLRQTGMDWGARKLARMWQEEAGLEHDLTTWFATGANAYIDALAEADLPFECKLFGYRPDRYTPLHTARLLQYFAYDLTFRHDEPAYTVLRDRLGEADYTALYPADSRMNVPVVSQKYGAAAGPVPGSRAMASGLRTMERVLAAWGAEGYRVPKGSNNWAVFGNKSATGAPILAGDMHLDLTLPAIWYEVHMVTPGLNIYGVLPPGTPVIVEAFNDALGWTYTNTGADVLDHYALDLDASGRHYRYGGAWRALERVPDTLHASGSQSVVDTLVYSHFGPVVVMDSGAVALRWVAHEPSRTLRALWDMNRARTREEFDAALEHFDVPAQNILYADTAGYVSIRSTGYIPVRRAGHGAGLLDGTADAFEWVGRIPFEDLPHALLPMQGYLLSANQQPTPPGSAHYLGHDWPDAYRALRIDSLLRARPLHGVEDFLRYQSDVHVVQRDLFVPLLETLEGLTPSAQAARERLLAWDGASMVDRDAPLVLDVFLRSLRRLAWDEPVFEDLPEPKEMTLLRMLREGSRWLDVAETEAVEDASGLLAMALERAADTLAVQYDDLQWGRHHTVIFRHLTQTPALQALWSGPHAYPGFDETISPAGGRPTTHGASWRMVLDFSQRPLSGYGIYPGGQSGRPLSRLYDLHVGPFLEFEHFTLHRPRGPGGLGSVSSRIAFSP